ncbi:MAG: MarC family protein [Parachlamydiales bacterium]|jgi:multiple antibiotic resistance protein
METVDMGLTSTAISLFLLMNAAALIPIFLSLLAPFDARKQKFIIIREMLFALAILFIFIFFGNRVLNSIGISPYVIGMAGGSLLVIISLNMIFPKAQSLDGLPKHEPFIVPLAIPCIAGPGSIASVMVFAKTEGVMIASGALVLAWLPSLGILLLANTIKKYIGDKGLQAVERLGGMLIFLIGIQMISRGIIDLVKTNF